MSDVLLITPCLTEKTRTYSDVDTFNKWFGKVDKRSVDRSVYKFIDLNYASFEFLNIQPILEGSERNIQLSFRTGSYVGAVPLVSPEDGKQIGDFIVQPRYGSNNVFESFVKIIEFLNTEIRVEIKQSLPLKSGSNFNPPRYTESIKFISKLKELLHRTWHKFNNRQTISNEFRGEINWKKYIENEAKVENKFKYPTRVNILDQNHKEFSQIRYVFDIAKKELNSHHTPISTRFKIRKDLAKIDQKLYYILPSQTDNIKIHASDSNLVKSTKKQANIILNRNFRDNMSWRIDASMLFERFVQYVFKKVSQRIGGQTFNNQKINSRFLGFVPSWSQRKLEPDCIFNYNDAYIFIDAKYKSHLYNVNSQSEDLKEEHRKDLHQILCYASFSNCNNNLAFLCYPSKKVWKDEITYQLSHSSMENQVILMGIPFELEDIDQAIEVIANIISTHYSKELSTI